MKDNYEDILHLPHHTSETHPRMPAEVRAAQFSPFAALTGYESIVRERGRLTEDRREWDESVKAELDRKLMLLSQILEKRLPEDRQGGLNAHSKEQSLESPEVTITYFEPDQQKDGGSYRGVIGQVTKIDAFRKVIIIQGEAIPIEQICGIDSNIFLNED